MLLFGTLKISPFQKNIKLHLFSKLIIINIFEQQIRMISEGSCDDEN